LTDSFLRYSFFVVVAASFDVTVPAKCFAQHWTAFHECCHWPMVCTYLDVHRY